MADPVDDWIKPTPADAGNDDWIVPGSAAPTGKPSMVGAAGRGAVRGAIPAAGGLVGAGAGAEAGAALGALGGPAAPFTVPAGAIIGGIGGALGGGYLAGEAQEKALSYLPESVKSYLGQSEKQRSADIEAHPYAAMTGEIAPNLLAFQPGAAARVAGEGAGAVERLMASPVTQRALPAGIMGAQEAAQEKIAGEPIDPAKVAISAGAGALMNRETELGRRLIGTGAAPVRAVTGRAAPAAATEPPPSAGENPTPPPAVGETIHMPMAGGVQPMTVSRILASGDVVLTGTDGISHPMTAADVQRMRVEAPSAPTPEAAGVPPAAQASAPAQGAAQPPLPQAAAASPPRLALPAPETVYGPGQGWASTGQGMIPGTPGFTMRPSTGDAVADLTEVGKQEAARAAPPSPATPQPPAAPPVEQQLAQAMAKLTEQATPRGGAPEGGVLATPPQAGVPEAPGPRPAAPVVQPPQPIQTPEPAAVPPTGPTPAEHLNAQIDRLRDLEIENAQPQGGDDFFQRKEAEMAGAPVSEPPSVVEPATHQVSQGTTLETPPGTHTVEPVDGTQVVLPGAPVETAPPPRAEPQPIAYRSLRGTIEPAFVPSTGAMLPVEYGIADARNLVTSHHDDLAPNSAFPQALQPRSRERAETEAQLAGILNGDPRDPNATFRPELLGENPDAANGAPIVGPEGYVESGNARTMAIRRAYDRGLPQAEQYRRYLEVQGYPVEGIEQPVLVRLNRSGLDMAGREQLARDLNVPPQATMSATDRAMADAQQIPPDLLRAYQGGDLFSAGNQPLWRGVLDRVAKPNELPALTNPEGGLSPAGRTRVQNAILAKAYGDSGIIAALTEDPDSNIKSIGGALLDAAPRWAQLRQAIAENRVPAEYDLTSPLLEAVRLISHARDEGRNVAEFLRQIGLFGDEISSEARDLIGWMFGAPDWSRRYGRDKIAKAVVAYAEDAMRPPRINEVRAAPAELVEFARQNAQGAAADLFSAPVEKPGGATPVRPGIGQDRPGDEGRGIGEAGATAPAEGARGAEPEVAAPSDLFAAQAPPAETAPTKPAPEMIQDAGEKIGGARKDRWARRALSVDDLEGMSGGEESKYVTKNAVWPQPDYAALIKGGMDPQAAALLKIVRDRLAAKPSRDTPEGRRNYIETMGQVRTAFEAAKTVADLKAARDAVIHDWLGWPRSGYERPAKDISEKLFSIFKGRKEQLGAGRDDLRKADSMVRTGFPQQAEEPWLRGVELRAEPAFRTTSGQNWKEGPPRTAVYRNGKYVRMFDTEDAARDWLREQHEGRQKDRDEGKLPERPHLDTLARTGPDVRNGRDVDSPDFVKDFGFRGVEFGNWVASDERQKAVNLAYDGLHDLANVLGVDPKALSLDGQLGLAFGARGSGRAAAHYEPEKMVINLTKLSGAGSLAHEWGHALDHYLGELDRTDANQGAPKGATGWYEPRDYSGRRPLANLRPELAQAVDNVMSALFKREKTRAEAVRDAEQMVETLTGRIAEQRRRVELSNENNKGNERGAEKFARDSARWIKAQERNLERAKQRLGEARGDKDIPPQNVESSYYQEAKRLSGNAGAKGYWARPTEMFARAFESYVFDKIQARENQSQYLVQGVEGDRYKTPPFKGNPYPTGLERPAINAAFDRLIGTLETREGRGGSPALHEEGQAFRAAQTPEFQNWFGDSKVVGPQGEPLRVYHGTAGDFEAFDPTRAGESTKHPSSELGHFFTADPGTANDFAAPRVDDSTWPPTISHAAGANIVPAYLSIKHPFEMSADKWRGLVWHPDEGEGRRAYFQQQRALLERKGYDGIRVIGDPKYRDSFSGGEYGHDNWVAFRPDQIKSAVGNRGTFDPGDPRIIAEGAPAAQPGAYRDTLADYQFRHGEPADPLAHHLAAREYVTEAGRDTGKEYLAAYDARTGRVEHAGTGNEPDRLSLSPSLLTRLADPDSAAVVVHHNHPMGFSLSGSDVALLATPGARAVVAHTQDGDLFSASLAPAARAALADLSPREAYDSLAHLYSVANDAVAARLQRFIDNGGMTVKQAEHIHADLVNRALNAAGVTDYIGSRVTDPLYPPLVKNILRQAATAVHDRIADYSVPWARNPDDALVAQSTLAVRPDEGMARLARETEAHAAGGLGGAERDQGSGAGTGEAAPAAALAEERPDYSDEAERATVAAAVGPPEAPRGGSWSERFFRMLGASPRSPGAGDHWFNLINKDFTTPRTKAALDPRSNAKWQAELTKNRDAAELVHGYRDGLDSWQGKDPETWRKLFAAMELMTLEQRQVPLDGRAIIAENRDYPLAALSKPGDVIRLTTPEEIGMFTDYRNTMDRIWQDLVGETARQFGWEGVPSAKAIQDAAEGMAGQERRRLERAAKIVAAIEFQHRDSYLPLMRSGDYFLRVRPREGTPDRPGILGWTGDGFPPTVMFKLIDSLTPMERATGGIREGTPKRAQAAVDELRQTFPEDAYSIDHGYAFRSTDMVRDLDIPSIDKLMMLVSTDARGQIADRLTHTGMDPETARKAAREDYDKLVDTVLDRIYEERVAGFKKPRSGVPGYESDFARSTGQYMNWLANHISDLRHRPAIDAADQGIDSHPDPRTRQFWKDWDRRQEGYGDQLYGPLAKMRHGAFLWLLGMNAATTAKILLHGPLRGVPVLGTGLGAAGRARAAGDYLNASRQLMGALTIGKDGLAVDFEKVSRSLTPAERALMADSEAKGILHPQTADELAAVKSQGEEALTERARFLRRVGNIWASNVSASDRMVRGAMLLSGYRTASRMGMDAINRVWDKDLNWRNAPVKTPESFGQFLVDQTVGIWGDFNRMPIARSPIGGMLTQFKTYELGYTSNLYHMLTRMGPEGKVTAALMLGGLGIMGGATALPFAQDIEGAIEGTYKLLGSVAPDLQSELRDAVDAIFGKGAGEVAVHGTRPLGIDWSGIGFGDLISRNAQSPLDLMGTAVSTFAGAPYRAYQREASGQGEFAAGRELLPNSVKHAVDALYPEVSLTSASGKSKIMSRDQVSDADRIKTGLGFYTETRALKYEQIRESIHKQDAYRQALTGAENRIANLIGRGDMDGVRQAQVAAGQLIAQGEREGVFNTQEMATFRRDLQRKIAQRLHPEIPTRTQQRMDAAHAAP